MIKLENHELRDITDYLNYFSLISFNNGNEQLSFTIHSFSQEIMIKGYLNQSEAFYILSSIGRLN